MSYGLFEYLCLPVKVLRSSLYHISIRIGGNTFI